MKLTTPDGAPNDRFGGAVSISGSAMIVGANLHDGTAEDAGAAYIYELRADTWELAQKVSADDGETGDVFGVSAAMDGDFAAVGALGDDDRGIDAGAVYIFQKQGAAWEIHSKLTADDGMAYDGFGFSVALEGDRLLVGARGVDDNGNSSGAAYLFQRFGEDWVLLQKLMPSDGSGGDFFGTSVAINEGFAVVGAVLADGEEEGAGAVYVFRNLGVNWPEIGKLTAEDGDWLDQFGSAVSLSGDVVLVGARSDDETGIDVGSAYVFEYREEGFKQVRKLKAREGASADFFGQAVALTGTLAVIGAPGADYAGAGAGAAYVFENVLGTWSQLKRLVPDEGSAGGEFGISVSASGSRAVVGAWGDGDENAAGAAYVFDVSAMVTGLEPASHVPQTITRLHVYPNPFWNEARVGFQLGASSPVKIVVYDALGRRVQVLSEGIMPAGKHEMVWRRVGQPAGVYSIRIQAGSEVARTILVTRL